MTHQDLVVLLSTVLFFALLHQFPVDGRRWESKREDAEPMGEPIPVRSEVPTDPQFRR